MANSFHSLHPFTSVWARAFRNLRIRADEVPPSPRGPGAGGGGRAGGRAGGAAPPPPPALCAGPSRKAPRGASPPAPSPRAARLVADRPATQSVATTPRRAVGLVVRASSGSPQLPQPGGRPGSRRLPRRVGPRRLGRLADASRRWASSATPTGSANSAPSGPRRWRGAAWRGVFFQTNNFQRSLTRAPAAAAQGGRRDGRRRGARAAQDPDRVR